MVKCQIAVFLPGKQRQVIYRYIQINNGFKLVSQNGTSLNPFQTTEGQLVLSLNQGQYLTRSLNLGSLEEALVINVSSSQMIGDSSLQLNMVTLSSETQDILARIGSFGILITFNEKIFNNKTDMSLDVLTKEQCERLNAYWDPVGGICYQCTVGSQYPDRVNMKCVDCAGALCGEHNGYCSGETGNPNVACTQIAGEKFTAACEVTGPCGGSCDGKCKNSVFGYTCQFDNNLQIYKCKFDKSKWWVILLWILLFLVIIGLIVGLSVWLFAPKTKTITYKSTLSRRPPPPAPPQVRIIPFSESDFQPLLPPPVVLSNTV